MSSMSQNCKGGVPSSQVLLNHVKFMLLCNRKPWSLRLMTVSRVWLVLLRNVPLGLSCMPGGQCKLIYHSSNIKTMSQIIDVTQGVALTGRNTTGPPCSVGRPTAHAPGRRCADRTRARRPAGPTASSVTDDDRRQPAKQYWPIRLASNNFHLMSIKIISPCWWYLF